MKELSHWIISHSTVQFWNLFFKTFFLLFFWPFSCFSSRHFSPANFRSAGLFIPSNFFLTLSGCSNLTSCFENKKVTKWDFFILCKEIFCCFFRGAYLKQSKKSVKIGLDKNSTRTFSFSQKSFFASFGGLFKKVTVLLFNELREWMRMEKSASFDHLNGFATRQAIFC